MRKNTPVASNDFRGGMDKDTSPQVLPASKYIDAKDLRVSRIEGTNAAFQSGAVSYGSTFKLSNLKGMDLAFSLPDIPEVPGQFYTQQVVLCWPEQEIPSGCENPIRNIAISYDDNTCTNAQIVLTGGIFTGSSAFTGAGGDTDATFEDLRAQIATYLTAYPGIIVGYTAGSWTLVIDTDPLDGPNIMCDVSVSFSAFSPTNLKANIVLVPAGALIPVYILSVFLSGGVFGAGSTITGTAGTAAGAYAAVLANIQAAAASFPSLGVVGTVGTPGCDFRIVLTQTVVAEIDPQVYAVGAIIANATDGLYNQTVPGTASITNVMSPATPAQADLCIIGYAANDKQVVLFTTADTNEYPGAPGSENFGQIWVLNIEDYAAPTPYTVTIPANLQYNNRLNFSKANQIFDAELIEETDCIVRVKWTDNYNPPRSFLLGSSMSTIAPELLAFNPQVRLQKLEFVSQGVGILPKGVYRYVTRLVSSMGTVTPWSIQSAPVIVAGSTSAAYKDVSSRFDVEAQNTNCSNILSVSNIDVRYQKLQVAALHYTEEFGDPNAIILFSEQDIVAPMMTVVHTSMSDPGILPTLLTAEEVFAQFQTFDRVKNLAAIGDRIYQANIVETPEIDIDLSGVTYQVIWRDIKSDDVLCDSDAWANGVTSSTRQTGAYDVVVPGYTPPPAFNLSNDFTDFKGVAVNNRLVSFMRGETYRVGVKFVYPNGKVGASRFLFDVTMPEIDDPSGDYQLAYDDGAGGIVLRVLGLNISNIDLSAYTGQISGFHIVIARRVKDTVAQGLVYNRIAAGGATYANAVDVTDESNPVALFLKAFGADGYSFLSPDTDFNRVIPTGSLTLVKKYALEPYCSFYDSLLQVGAGGRNNDVKCINKLYLASNSQRPNQNLTTDSWQLAVDEKRNPNGWKFRASVDSAYYSDILSADFGPPQLITGDETGPAGLPSKVSFSPFRGTTGAALYNLKQGFAGYGPEETTIYYPVGHTQPVDITNPGVGYVYSADVFGGDTFVTLYSRLLHNHFATSDGAEFISPYRRYMSGQNFGDIPFSLGGGDSPYLFVATTNYAGQQLSLDYEFRLPDNGIGLHSAVYETPTMNGGGELEARDTISGWGVVFPVESSVNTTLRYVVRDLDNKIEQLLLDEDPFEMSINKVEGFNYQSVFSLTPNLGGQAGLPANFDFNCSTAFATRMYASRQKSPGEKYDSHVVFPVNDFTDLPLQYGEINHIFPLAEQGVNSIWCLQALATSYVPIGPYSQNVNGAGQVVLGTGSIFSPAIFLDTSVGCVHKGSCLNTNNRAYFYCANRRRIFRIAGNSLQDLTSQAAMVSFINDTTKYLSQLDNPLFRGGIHTVYDSVHDEVLFTLTFNDDPGEIPEGYPPQPTLPEGITVEPWTLVYNERTDAFVSFYTPTPGIYVPLTGGRILSPNPANCKDVYLHYANPQRNLFYGAETPTESYMVFVVNPDMFMAKAPANIVLQLNEAWDNIECVSGGMTWAAGAPCAFRGDIGFLTGSGLRRYKTVGGKYEMPIPVVKQYSLDGGVTWVDVPRLGQRFASVDQLFVRVAVASVSLKEISASQLYFVVSKPNV